jgi:hypothetical protein
MGKPSPGRRARCCCSLFAHILFGGILFTSFQRDLRAQSSQPPQGPQAGTCPAAQEPGSKSQNEEITSHDSPATFKGAVNLVFVRVVVRDPNGKAIPNLKKDYGPVESLGFGGQIHFRCAARHVLGAHGRAGLRRCANGGLESGSRNPVLRAAKLPAGRPGGNRIEQKLGEAYSRFTGCLWYSGALCSAMHPRR